MKRILLRVLTQTAWFGVAVIEARHGNHVQSVLSFCLGVGWAFINHVDSSNERKPQ